MQFHDLGIWLFGVHSFDTKFDGEKNPLTTIRIDPLSVRRGTLWEKFYDPFVGFSLL